MQELMFKMDLIIKHYGPWFLGLGKSVRGFEVFELHYYRLITS